MGNSTCFTVRVALFTDHKKQMLLASLGDTIKDRVTRCAGWPWFNFRINLGDYIFMNKDWCSETSLKSIELCRLGLRNPDINTPWFSIQMDEINGGANNGLTSPHGMMWYMANGCHGNDQTIEEDFAKKFRCCVETRFLDSDSNITRCVYMFDGVKVTDEDPELPFLDVVKKHWEAAVMRMTLSGEWENENICPSLGFTM